MLDTFTCHRYELNHLFKHLVLLQISFVLYDIGVYTTRRKQYTAFGAPHNSQQKEY